MAAHFTIYDFSIAVARFIKEAYNGAGTNENQLIQLTVLFSD